MAKLQDIASRARDLYNQDYPDRNEFFDEADFKFHLAAKYSATLNQLFQAKRVENKAEFGFSNVDINPQWLIRQDIEKTDIQHDKERHYWYINTNFPVFSFDFDSFGNGLNGIQPYGAKCNMKKINTQELRFRDIIPETPDIYYFLEGSSRINFTKDPGVKLSIFYIPEVLASNQDCVMSDNIVSEMIMTTLQLMFGAKNGNVVKESNDGNKNDTIQQQTNPSLTKVQTIG